MAWTTAGDVIGSWIGDGAPTDAALVDSWIGRAERLVRRSVPDIQARLDAEAARQALVNMVEQSNDRTLSALGSRLPTAPIRAEDDGKVRISHWVVDLDRREFKVVAGSSRIVVVYSGVFRHTSGRWAAETTLEQRAE